MVANRRCRIRAVEAFDEAAPAKRELEVAAAFAFDAGGAAFPARRGDVVHDCGLEMFSEESSRTIKQRAPGKQLLEGLALFCLCPLRISSDSASCDGAELRKLIMHGFNASAWQTEIGASRNCRSDLLIRSTDRQSARKNNDEATKFSSREAGARGWRVETFNAGVDHLMHTLRYSTATLAYACPQNSI